MSLFKEKQKLLIAGHYFIKFKEDKGVTSWCCDKKGTLKCKSIVKTSVNDGNCDIKEGPTKHNHEDPQGRKFIVSTPKKSIIRDSKRIFNAIELDFEENPTEMKSDDVRSIKSKKIRRRKPEPEMIIPYVDKPIEPDFGVKEIKFVKFPHLKYEQLFIDGYYFKIKKVISSYCVWMCTRSVNKTRCPVRITTSITSGAHKLRENIKMEHIHGKKIKKSDSISTDDMTDASTSMEKEARQEIAEFQPPTDCEIECIILFGLRRQMLPEQIFNECQSIYGLDAPPYEIVCEYCKRFQNGHYPEFKMEFRKSMNDSVLVRLNRDDDPNMSRELLTIQPDIVL